MIIERTKLQIPSDGATDATIEFIDTQAAATPLWRMRHDTGANAWTLVDVAAGQPVMSASETTSRVDFPVGATVAGSAVLTQADEGDANGLDADTVDTYHGADLAALAEAETVTGDWEFAGERHVSDDRTRLTGFGASGHWVRYSADDADQILGITRAGVNDYRVRIQQAGAAEDVLTTGDAVDAASLDGLDSSQFVRADESDTLAGDLNVTGTLSEAGEAVATDAELTTHTGTADAHHTKTTSQGDLTDFGSDAPYVHVTATEPGAPQTNDLWFDTAASGGLNAGSLDGLDSSQFLRSDVNDTMAADLDVTGTLSAAGTPVATTTDVSDDIATHTGDAAAHHTKTTSQADLTDFSSAAPNLYVQATEPGAPQANDIWFEVP